MESTDAPSVDRQLTVEHYMRTQEQDLQLGLQPVCVCVCVCVCAHVCVRVCVCVCDIVEAHYYGVGLEMDDFVNKSRSI